MDNQLDHSIRFSLIIHLRLDIRTRLEVLSFFAFWIMSYRFLNCGWNRL